MQFTYELEYRIYNKYRKNQALVADKGKIPAPYVSGTLRVRAENDEQAFDKVKAHFSKILPGDTRPIAGESYLRFARQKHWTVSRQTA